MGQVKKSIRQGRSKRKISNILKRMFEVLSRGESYDRTLSQGAKRERSWWAFGAVPLPVTLTHHDIVSPKNRDRIRNHIPLTHMVKRAHVDE